MNFADVLKKMANYTQTQNAALTNASSLSPNLDLFSTSYRFLSYQKEEFQSLLHQAFNEDIHLASKNILYMLDIRSGKGERDSFKIAFQELIQRNLFYAEKILKQIGNLGRWDYILEAMGTPLEEQMIAFLKEEIEKNLSGNISLVGKWLPSLRTHKKNNPKAYRLAKLLSYTPKEYRKVLKTLREQLNLIETKISNKENDFEYEHIPSKAMLKYQNYFVSKHPESYQAYLESLNQGKANMNANNLFMDEIVGKELKVLDTFENPNSKLQLEALDFMWEKQDQIDCQSKNILVVADTSGSMKGRPYNTAMALAIYFSEKNRGIFHNKFITFSSQPRFHVFEDNLHLSEKLRSIVSIIENTDIDKVFDLILRTALSEKLSQEDFPDSIILVSDMEFDSGVYSKEKTNFQHWKKTFSDCGYKLPKIIFWNVANSTRVFPVIKTDCDVLTISGYSKKILENILTLEEFNPYSAMIEVLSKYEEYLA